MKCRLVAKNKTCLRRSSGTLFHKIILYPITDEPVFEILSLIDLNTANGAIDQHG